MATSLKGGFVRAYHPAFWLLQRLADLFAIWASHYIACRIYPQPWDESNTVATAVAVIGFYLASEPLGVYRSWRGAWFRTEIRAMLGAWMAVVPMLLLLAFAVKTTQEFSRVVTFTWFVLAPTLLFAARGVKRLILRAVRTRGRNNRKVAIFGATDIGIRLAKYIQSEPSLGLEVEFIFDERRADRLVADAAAFEPIHGKLDDLIRVARLGCVDDIYIALPLCAERRIAALVRNLADTTVNVHYAPDFFAFDLLHSKWGQLGEFPMVSLLDSPFRGGAAFLKRIEDLVVGAAILVLISIPMLVIAACIKFTSPGPVFFRQKRYGLNGREFGVLKFRSMNVCEDGPCVVQARRNDPRVTRLGAFLRKTSLDELPQFINVLMGDMSIVGPRPHAVAHNELYRPMIYGYMLRHKVKPGITGWAQVNGWRGETDTVTKMEKRVEHDLAYINNWNLWWDFQIIVLTVLGRKKNLNAF